MQALARREGRMHNTAPRMGMGQGSSKRQGSRYLNDCP